MFIKIYIALFFSLFIQRSMKKKILFQIYLIFWILYIQHGTNEENEAISNCQLQMSGSQILKGWPIWQRRNCYTWQVCYMNSIGVHNNLTCTTRRRSINFSKGGGWGNQNLLAWSTSLSPATVLSLHRWERIVCVGDGKFMRF